MTPVARVLLAFLCAGVSVDPLRLAAAQPGDRGGPPAALQHAAFDPGAFQRADGAITALAGGGVVEPYFAVRALLDAHAAGLEVDGPARSWIAWAIPRQLPDGRFERACADEALGGWAPCGPADADDALLALWIELLETVEDRASWPPAWEASAAAAARALDRLRTPAGLYRVAPTLDVALFMDNAEIEGSLRRRARLAAGQEGGARALLLKRRADSLARSLVRVFWDVDRRRFRASTQEGAETEGFYPGAVAQVYPWVEGIETPEGDPVEAFRRWMGRHGKAWLAIRADTYPWGMVALASVRLGHPELARCWRVRAEPYRHGPRWNVLEEANFQALGPLLPPQPADAPPPCTRMPG